MIRRILHRLAHWLHQEGCINECYHLEGNRFAHVVICGTCGQVVFWFVHKSRS